jgi:flagellar biosynthetic protein FliQ
MTPESVITLAAGALNLTLILLAITLLPALAVGLLVSMFQAATQINEMTLSFIPKLLITLVMLMLAGPWMLHLMLDYMRRLMESIPLLIG